MKKLQLYSLLFFVGLLISGIHPKEYFTWFLEVIPAIIGFAILAFTFKRFQFTNFTYFFIRLSGIFISEYAFLLHRKFR